MLSLKEIDHYDDRSSRFQEKTKLVNDWLQISSLTIMDSTEKDNDDQFLELMNNKVEFYWHYHNE